MEEQETAQEQLEQGVQIENMSNEALAMVVSEGLKYEFSKSFLVKQMPTQMIDKVMKMPFPTGEKDEDGNDITEMKEETMQVESVLRSGIILKVPTSLTKIGDDTYKVGDTIVYRNLRATDFDLFKDSTLVDPFDVICKEI